MTSKKTNEKLLRNKSALIIDLQKHMGVSLVNVAVRLHNEGVRHNSIPVDTFRTQDSVKIRVVDYDKVQLTYNTEYAQYAWAYNLNGELEWSLKDWKTHKNKICKLLIKDLLTKGKPMKEMIIR